MTGWQGHINYQVFVLCFICCHCQIISFCQLTHKDSIFGPSPPPPPQLHPTVHTIHSISSIHFAFHIIYQNILKNIPPHPYTNFLCPAMNKSLKAVKKMKGFMCHSPASTAVCMNQDYMSVIVPRNLDRKIVDRAKLINNAKYIRLGEPCKVSTTDHRRPINVSSLKKEKENGHPEVSSIAASHNVYQVI